MRNYREPTDAEYAAAKRAVARIAKKVRDLSGNPSVRGHIGNAYVLDGIASFTLTCNYGYLDMVKAAREVGMDNLCVVSMDVQAEIPVAYPKQKN